MAFANDVIWMAFAVATLVPKRRFGTGIANASTPTNTNNGTPL